MGAFSGGHSGGDPLVEPSSFSHGAVGGDAVLVEGIQGESREEEAEALIAGEEALLNDISCSSFSCFEDHHVIVSLTLVCATLVPFWTKVKLLWS